MTYLSKMVNTSWILKLIIVLTVASSARALGSVDWTEATRLVRQIEGTTINFLGEIYHSTRMENPEVGEEIFEEAGFARRQTGIILNEVKPKLQSQTLTAPAVRQVRKDFLRQVGSFGENISFALQELEEPTQAKVNFVFNNGYNMIEMCFGELIKLLSV